MVIALRSAAAMAALIALVVVAFVAREAAPALRAVGALRFLNDAAWHPVQGEYNLAPMVLGSVAVVSGALLIATPIGLGSAIFARFYAPRWLVPVHRSIIELLGAVPSVVLGLWGLVVLVPLVGRMHPPGPSCLAGMVVLAIMIVPTMALSADVALASVPAASISAAAALGLGRASTIVRVVLPAARSGILTGMLLQTGRALGETMAVLMVCGNVVQMPSSLFTPVRTLTANIALEMAYAGDLHRAALFVSGLVLTIVVIALTFAADWFSRGSGDA